MTWEIGYNCVDCKKDFIFIKTKKNQKAPSLCPECRAVRRFESFLQGRTILDSRDAQQEKIEQAKQEVRKVKKRKSATIEEVMELAKELNLSYGKMRSLLERKRIPGLE